MALTTTSATGTQTNTQTPQAAGAAGATGTDSGSVQPGTSTDLLNGQASTGVPLTGAGLTLVNLPAATAQTQVAAVPTHRHINPALFSVSVLFFLVAIALFWFTSRSEKNTTN